MAPSAPDVITYVGVPLAVLGVLPILFTAFRALLLSYKVRRIINRNLKGIGLQRHIRSNTDLLSGQVDVKFDRVRLWPLQQSHKEYRLLRTDSERSRLKGGSWTILNWSLDVGDLAELPRKKYTLTPSDDLRQPAAWVDLSSLVWFLLDIGAIVNRVGLEKLQTEEQRTVSGTVLLKSRDGRPVLSVTNRESDEDHDTLALKLTWPGVTASVSDLHEKSFVRPNWVKIEVAIAPQKSKRTKFLPGRPGGRAMFYSTKKWKPEEEMTEEEKADKKAQMERIVKAPNGRTVPASVFLQYEEGPRMIESFEADWKPEETGWEDIIGDRGHETDEETFENPIKHAQYKEGRRDYFHHIKERYSTPAGYLEQTNIVDPKLFCVDIESDTPTVAELLFSPKGLDQAHLVADLKSKSHTTDISILHLCSSDSIPDSEFSAGDWFSSLAKSMAPRDQVLCRYNIPPAISKFSHDAHTLKPSVPVGILLLANLITQDDSPKWKPEDAWQMWIEKDREYRSMTMRQPKFDITKMNQGPKHFDVQRQVEANRVPYALKSPAWSVSKIATLMLPYLQNEFVFLPAVKTSKEITLWTLHRMLLHPKEAAGITKVLNAWYSWSEQNSMDENDYILLRGHKTTFALVACLLDVLGGFVGEKNGIAVEDLLEQCLERWGDVLLN
ncbi:MAG: hypothetical protein MMC33_010284 [Icmadophila ericetorum]|nr:hypothetical protein [Icmadophila ericetorum]